MIVFKILCGYQSGLRPRTLLPAPLNLWSVFLRRHSRLYGQQNRKSAWRSIVPNRRPFCKETSKPIGSTAFKIGRKEVVGTIFGVGSLRYWGPGSSSEEGIVKKSSYRLLPLDVRDRVYVTYIYFGLSIAITAAGIVLGYRRKVVLLVFVSPFWASILCTWCLARQIKSNPVHDIKKIPWILYSAIVGFRIAPLRFIGDQILLRAAIYTVGVVGGLSSVAVCAPSDTFLKMNYPLTIGLGLITLWIIGSIYLDEMAVLGFALLAISAFGCLIIFGGFTLLTTQKIMKCPDAETHPSNVLVDPYKEAIYFHLYTINIFLSIVTILILRGAH